jgi:lipoyl(octanoyl) transferase
MIFDDCVDYTEMYREQLRLHSLRVDNKIQDTCIILQHKEVYTSGRSSESQDIFNRQLQIVETDRGGKITWHGPGQLIVYTIFKLEELQYGLYSFLLSLAQSIIFSIAEIGYPYLVFLRESPGLWNYSGKKVASLGLRLSKGVTMHGMSINCNNSLKAFSNIRPCGMDSELITSISKELGREIDMKQLNRALIKNIEKTFRFTGAKITYES